MTTAGVILAAGAGRRFGGGIKQLALHDGEPLVRRACRTALDAGLAPVLVVLGAHADAVGAALRDLDVIAVHNPRWEDGMGTSLACAIRELDEGSDAADITDVAVLLADQPLVTAAHLRALVAARLTSSADVAATDTGETFGVPAVFARALFPTLTSLTGDRGARDLIARADHLVTVPFAPAAVDIDT